MVILPGDLYDLAGDVNPKCKSYCEECYTIQYEVLRCAEVNHIPCWLRDTNSLYGNVPTRQV